VLSHLHHPNIVKLHDRGVIGECAYLVTDWVSGRPLDAWRSERPRPVRDLVHLFRKVCAVTHAAHLKGVIHRDLKPGNILVDEADEPFVLDFGIAKVGAPDVRDRTRTGEFIGSLPWASPEQAAGSPDRIDVRTDVYSLGVLFYQLLTDRFPYDVDGRPRDVLNAIVLAEPVPPRRLRPEIDAEIETIVLKCLEKD